MNKTSLRQKISLFLFGVLAAAIILELALRLAGVFVLFLQERHNHSSFQNNEYRILCLGESTTALGGEDSYPSLLETILNAQSRQIKFKVINEGIISTTSKYILDHVDQNLDKYKPQLVIVMMGINDKAYLNNTSKSLWWESFKANLKDFRVYKLVHLIFEHLIHKIHGSNLPPKVDEPVLNDEGHAQQVENVLKLIIAQYLQQVHRHLDLSMQYQKNNQLEQSLQEKQTAQQLAKMAGLFSVQLAQRYRLKGLTQEAENILEQASLLTHDDTALYQEWGELYLVQKQSSQAIKAFQLALSLDPKNDDAMRGLARAYFQAKNDNAFLIYSLYLKNDPQDYWGYLELAKWLRHDKHYDLAETYLSQAIAIGPDFEEGYLDLARVLDDQALYEKEEAFYLKEISLHPKNSSLYQGLGQFYQNHGRLDLAKDYFQKAAQSQMAEYLPDTLVNYSLLVDKILKRHIKVVVMQYPLRDIVPLEKYLGGRNLVTFVENQENFKKAMLMGGYGRYFKDNFAYNFGHCTRAGNELIARHLIETVFNKML